MKKLYLIAFAALFTTGTLAQSPAPGKRVRVSSPSPASETDVVFHRMPGPAMHAPMGKWWKDSELVKTVGISEAQVKQIEQIFYDHRLKLIDMRADLEREEAKLQPLIESDTPDEAKVGAQIDAVSAARGRLEKANALMMLSIRKVLTLEQWKKLQEVKQQRHTKVFERRFSPGIMAPPPGAPVERGPGASKERFDILIPRNPEAGMSVEREMIFFEPFEMAFAEPFSFGFGTEPFDIMLAPEAGFFEFHEPALEFEPFDFEFPAVIPLLEDKL